jgi:hypothetical protein
MVWSRVGTKVPSTSSTVSLRNRLRGLSTSDGARWSMMRPAADYPPLRRQLVQSQVRPLVRGDRQNPVLQRQAQRSPPVIRVCLLLTGQVASCPQGGYQRAELPWAGGEDDLGFVAFAEEDRSGGGGGEVDAVGAPSIGASDRRYHGS